MKSLIGLMFVAAISSHLLDQWSGGLFGRGFGPGFLLGGIFMMLTDFLERKMP